MAKIYDFKTKALLADLPTELTPNPMPIPIAVNDSGTTFFDDYGIAMPIMQDDPDCTVINCLSCKE